MSSAETKTALVVGPRRTAIPVGEVMVDAGWNVVVADGPLEAGQTAPRTDAGWIGLLDWRDAADLVLLPARARDLGGRLDALVLHLPATSRALAADADLAVWRADIEQLANHLLLARAFAEVASPGAAVVQVTSIDLAQSYPNRSSAAVLANGLVGLTRTLAIEWAKIPIRVNVVALGVVLGELDIHSVDHGESSLERVLLRSPSHRLGSMAEAAELVRFLVEDGSQFITGQTVWADGGWAALTQHAEGLRFP